MEIIKSINSSLQQEPEEKRLYIGASQIGGPCLRAIWYSYKGYEKKFSEQTKLTFAVGKQLEKLLIKKIKDSDIDIISNHSLLEVYCKEFPVLKGNLDGILKLPSGEKLVLEIKTAKSASFSVFKREGVKAWSTVYFYQIQAYMGMAGVLGAVLLAINKDTSELHEEWVDFDEKIYKEMIRKAELIASFEGPPPKVHENPAFYICSRCEFKDICHGY